MTVLLDSKERVYEVYPKGLQLAARPSLSIRSTNRNQLAVRFISIHIHITRYSLGQYRLQHIMGKVPAWKRLGLSVKKDVHNNALQTTEHLGDEVVTNKVAKKLSRSYSEGQDKKEKKPPKRKKLPKADRKPPPEKDQLAYLKQFAEDKDNWKFSKQKQNWLLKNIETIPQEYEAALKSYVDSIQGGARLRLEEQLKEVVDEWNAIAKKLEEKIEAELFGKKEDSELKDDAVEKKSGGEDKTEVKNGPSMEYALKCKSLLDVLLDEPVLLIGAEESVIDEVNVEDIKTEEGDKKDEDEAEPSDNSEGSDSSSESSEVPEENTDNLIIEEIEVNDYVKANKEN